MNVFLELHWGAIAVAAVASFALGRQGEPPTKPAPLFLVGSLVCGLVTTVASAMLIQALKIQSMAEELIFGAVVGMVLVALQ